MNSGESGKHNLRNSFWSSGDNSRSISGQRISKILMGFEVQRNENVR